MFILTLHLPSFFFFLFACFTATSSALSHEVSPGGQAHQFWLEKDRLGRTSVACGDAAPAEREARWSAAGPARQRACDEGVEEEEAEAASPPGASCWTLWMRAECGGPWNRGGFVSGGFGGAWAWG